MAEEKVSEYEPKVIIHPNMVPVHAEIEQARDWVELEKNVDRNVADVAVNNHFEQIFARSLLAHEEDGIDDGHEGDKYFNYVIHALNHAKEIAIFIEIDHAGDCWANW